LETPNNWTDCTTVRIVTNGTNQLLAPYGGNPNCSRAYPLQCPGAQYKEVVMPTGYTLAALASAVSAQYALLNDSSHVKTPNTPGCADALLGFVCGKWFQSCNDPGTCESSCLQATCLCTIQNTNNSNDDWDCGLAILPNSLSDLNGPCDHVYSPSRQCYSSGFHISISFVSLISFLLFLFV